jgi:PKD repeat protein
MEVKMKVYLAVFIIVFCLTANIFSQIQFTTHIITPGAGTTDNATYVLAFDVENDGDMDIVSSSFLDNKVAWYENDGSQNFEQHIITTNAKGATWLFATDMDGDEDVDVLSASAVDDKVNWYENDGQGNFTTHVADSSVNPSGWLRFSVYAYDVDSDSDMDVLSGSWDSPAVKWHENDGNQNFTTHLIANPGQQSSVIAKDLDGDGDADILSASKATNTVAWYENDGNQNFAMHTISNSVSIARVVAAIDLDNDGDIDVATAPSGGKFKWFENDGNQNFTTHSISEGPSQCQSIYVIDMDDDDDLDILIVSPHDDLVGWLENDGNQNFTWHVIETSVLTVDTVWGEDVDGDGDIDVLSADLDADQIAWYENLMPPIAYFSADTTSGSVPFTVQFFDSSRGGRTSWKWDFGDDSTSTEQNPMHVYNVADTFAVSLAVTGPNGADTLVRENYIIATDPTIISRPSDLLPARFELYNNYPNPFNPSTTIEFVLPQSGFLTLKVYNILGQEVVTLLEAYKPAGQYSVNFNASQLSSGIYYYTLTTDNFKQTRKMVLLR